MSAERRRLRLEAQLVLDTDIRQYHATEQNQGHTTNRKQRRQQAAILRSSYWKAIRHPPKPKPSPEAPPALPPCQPPQAASSASAFAKLLSPLDHLETRPDPLPEPPAPPELTWWIAREFKAVEALVGQTNQVGPKAQHILRDAAERATQAYATRFQLDTKGWTIATEWQANGQGQPELAVYAVDPTGTPRLIQRLDEHLWAGRDRPTTDGDARAETA